MLKLIRWVLGLCNHHYITNKIENIPWRSNDNGSIIITDLSMKGVIRVRRHWQTCVHCGKLKHVDVKMGKRK